MILPSNIALGRLPANYSGTPAEYYAAFRNRLRGYVPDDKVLVGYSGPNEPKLDLGPWVHADPTYVGPLPPLEIWTWNGSRYSPMPINIGTNYTKFIRLTADAKGVSGSGGLGSGTFLQDASGTVALLYDILVPRETVILSGATPSINWSKGDSFIHRLSANATYTHVAPVDGSSVFVALQNNATAFTATFPGVKWPGGTPPVQPVGAAGKNAVGLYRFWYVINTLYGELKLSSTASPAVEVDTNPADTAGPGYGQTGFGRLPVHSL